MLDDLDRLMAEHGIGVRIEDTFRIAEDGRAVSFCEMGRGMGV